MAETLTPPAPDPERDRSARRTPRVLRLVGGRRSERVPTAATLPPRPESRPRPLTTARTAAYALLLVTALLLGFVLYLVFGAALTADREQDVLYQQLRTDLAEATVPVSGAIPAGTPLGVVSIPRIGLEQVFVEGSSSEQTRNGPGLKTDSVLPGQTGLSVLVGHRSVSGAAFAHLDELAPGDTIEVTTGQGRFTYVVDLVRTSDAPTSQVQVVPARLSLVTADPAYAPNRNLTVSAVLRGKALPAATGTTAPTSDQPRHGSKNRLVSLLLWSQLLLVVSLLVTWAALRLPRRGLWIGAAPVLLAVLWQVFENLAVLLPNTL